MTTVKRRRPANCWLRPPERRTAGRPADPGGTVDPALRLDPETDADSGEGMRGAAHPPAAEPGSRWRATLLHPGARILIYALAALALPVLDPIALALLTVLALLASVTRRREVWRLLRRARWLLLLLVLTYAYGVPGEAIWPRLGMLSPTQEGLAQGLLQTWRLGVLLLLLDILVLRMPIHALLGGIHSVLAPLAVFGLDRARATLRLALTLEAMTRPLAWDGIQAIIAGRLPEATLPDRYTLVRQAYGWVDGLVLAALLLGIVWLYA